ncbi:MAG: hypothetical protein FJ404_16185 [Verrucomicrobia bacterium]|nr:hypothetical protein [Verrucomicrobiota bacterium]
MSRTTITQQLAFSILMVIVAMALTVGCGKKPVTGGKAGALTDSTLPGAEEVIKAATAKDYPKAMQLWADLRAKVTDNEQAGQFTILTSELKFKLLEAPQSDAKAQEALGLLRATTIGR